MAISATSSRYILDKMSRVARNEKIYGSNSFRALFSQTQLRQDDFAYQKYLTITSPRLHTSFTLRDDDILHSTIYSPNDQVSNEQNRSSNMSIWTDTALLSSSIYHYVQTPINLALSYIRSLANAEFFTSGIFLIKRTYQPRYVK